MAELMRAPGRYRPLYAERRCVICGFWRGQHRVEGYAGNDYDMHCPVDIARAAWFGAVPTFIAQPLGRDR